MRKSIFYQPLAVLMAILLAPPLSWLRSFGSGNRGHGAHLFQAAAQSGTTNPIQTKPDVDLWEYSAVSAYLAAHNLPATDRGLIYSTGRKDLRDEIRGLSFTNLVGIINTPTADRTVDEQATYSQFQKLVQNEEIAEYTAAVNEFNRFQNDPCNFTLDGDIASQYKLTYDGSPWCIQSINLTSTFAGGPPVPAASYFIAYGWKNSYDKDTSGLQDILSGTLINTTPAIGVLVGSGVGGTTASIITAAAVNAALPAAEALRWIPRTIQVAGEAVTKLVPNVGDIELVSQACVDAVSEAALTAGPGIIVAVAAIIGTVAGFQAYSNDQNLKDGKALSDTLASVTNNPPDLHAFINDKLGVLKLGLLFSAQTAPDTPGAAPLPAHRTDYRDLVFSIDSVNPLATNVRDTLQYYGWNGANEIWSAQTYGGWLVQTCSGSACKQPDSLSTGMRFLFTDSDGTTIKYTASRIGDHVVGDKWAVSMAQPGPNDIHCPVDPSTGLTPGGGVYPMWGTGSNPAWGPSPVRCSTFVTDRLFMNDANGLSTPTTNTSVPYVIASLRLRPGVSAAPPQFTSAAGAQAFYDTPFSFVVTTTGGSIPARLSVSWVPDGLTFTDNGDGTAVIKGTINRFSSVWCLVGGSYPCAPSVITATNPWGTVTQNLFINVVDAPSATMTATSATFIAGIPNAVTLFSQGAQTPVTWGMMGPNFSPLPSWLGLIDRGDGTAVLAGTPPLGTVAAIPLNISVGATGSALGVLNFGANFTLNVSNAPGFVQSIVDDGSGGVLGDTGQFTVGSSAASFTVFFTDGTVSITRDTLPIGLKTSTGSDASGSWLKIDGQPAAGMGGAYPLTLTATNASGSASKDVTVEVFEQPKITTDVNMQPNFYKAPQEQATPWKNSFSFTTLGYPDRGKAPSVANPPVPTDPRQGLGMYFTVTGLPGSLTYSALDPTGHATGTLTISGLPAQADLGDHRITITATNGVGMPAQQSFTLSLSNEVGDVDGDGFTTCNDVLALDKVFGSHIGDSSYNPRADINNDGLVNWADMQLVWTHLYSPPDATTAQCQQAVHKPSTPAVFEHKAEGATTSHESTIIDYITSGGVKDEASLSKGIWTGLHGSGPDLIYETWDGALWSARVLSDGVTFQHTNVATGEVRISQILNYKTWDGSHWTMSIVQPSW